MYHPRNYSSTKDRTSRQASLCTDDYKNKKSAFK